MQPEPTNFDKLTGTPFANPRGCHAAHIVDGTTGAKKQGKEKKPEATLVSLVFPG